MTLLALSMVGSQGSRVFVPFLKDTLESMKCIAWKGRLLVVGFAGGTIEKVRSMVVLPGT